MLRRLRAWFLRAGAVVCDRPRQERELSDELRSHLQLHIDDNLRAGMPPGEARRAALVKLGGVECIREQRRTPWLDAVRQDLRYAVRQLRRDRRFALVAILSLALSIGAAAAVFSAVEGLLLNPYPYDGADRMVFMSQAERTAPLTRRGGTVDDARLFLEAGSLDGVMLWDEFWMWTREGGLPATIYAGKVSPNTFQFLGIPPLVGRVFAGVLSGPANESAPVAVLSYRYWRTHFGGSPDAIGRTLPLDGLDHTIIGVMPETFRFRNADVYVPLPGRDGPFGMLLRLRRGVSRDAAIAEVQALVQQHLDQVEHAPNWRDVRIALTSLNDDAIGANGAVLAILVGAVALLLVIGCVNVSILLVARGITRQYELAVRGAIGASDARILRQLLTESIVVSIAGGIAAMAVAYGSLAGILRWIPPRLIPPEVHVGVDLRVLAFAIALAVLVGVVTGISPAIRFSRTRFNLVGRLGARSDRAMPGAVRAHSVLTLAQIAATVVLLAGAGAALRTVLMLTSAPLGYDPKDVAVLGVTLKPRTFTTWQERATYYERLRAAVASVPGVASAAVTGPAPLPPVEPRRSPIEVPGRSTDADRVVIAMVSSEYFPALRVPLRAGRTWTNADDVRSAHVAVVNSTLARRYWPAGDPLGQRVRLGALRTASPFQADSPGNDQWVEIVGVVGDVRNDGLRNAVLPEVYVPYTLLTADAVLLLARTTATRGGIVDAVKRQIAMVNGDQPVMSSSSLEERLWENGWARQQFVASLFSACAALALALAAVGMYSVVAYAVSRRLREFGLRIALGASGRRIVVDIFRVSATTIALGLGCGLLLVAILHRPIAAWTESTLWDVTSLAPSMAVLVIVGCAAILVPAWQAATLSPMRVLQADE